MKKAKGFDVELKHTTWSPSKLGCYLECPARAKYKYLEKLPDPGGPALVRGSFVHEQCEHYVAGRIKALASIYQGEPLDWHPKTVAELKRLRKVYPKGKVRTELDLGLTAQWQKCEWMAPNVWVRAKVDLIELNPKKGELAITDWKTGRFKPDGEYDDQLCLYCTALLSAFPEYNTATARLWFTDVGEQVTRHTGRLERKGLENMQKAWSIKVAPMFKDTEHAPTPSPGCRFCPYSVQKSGPCKF